jgi:hypothetical protein
MRVYLVPEPLFPQAGLKEIGIDDLHAIAEMKGESLEVSSWDDSDFRLVADAFEGLPEPISELYGCTAIGSYSLASSAVAVGYLSHSRICSLVETLPSADFDNPSQAVVAAREELEGWLRTAATRDKSLLIFWD